MYCDIFRGINYKSYFTLCWNVLIDNSYISVYCADSQSLVIRYHYVDKVLDKYYFLFSRKTHESRYIFIIVCLFVCKSVFILAYFSKCNKPYGLYSHLRPLYSKHWASYQSEIWVAKRLPNIASCQVLYSSTCIADCT